MRLKLNINVSMGCLKFTLYLNCIIMSLFRLEQSLRSEQSRPWCVRVNMRLWCALKTENLIPHGKCR